jgi:hypothetical protein
MPSHRVGEDEAGGRVVRVTVRSQALAATAARVEAVADEVRATAQRLASVAARVRPPPVWRPDDAAVFAQWLRLEAEATRAVLDLASGSLSDEGFARWLADHVEPPMDRS